MTCVRLVCRWACLTCFIYLFTQFFHVLNISPYILIKFNFFLIQEHNQLILCKKKRVTWCAWNEKPWEKMLGQILWLRFHYLFVEPPLTKKARLHLKPTQSCASSHKIIRFVLHVCFFWKHPTIYYLLLLILSGLQGQHNICWFGKNTDWQTLRSN